MLYILRLSALALTALLVAHQTAAAERLLWVADGKPTRQAAEMLKVLRDAGEYGLQRDTYRLGLSPAHLHVIFAGDADALLRSRFDEALIHSVTQFATDLHQGRVSAEAAGFHLPVRRPTFDSAEATRELARTTDVRSTLASLEPRPQPYRSLKQALAQYHDLASQQGLNELPPLPRRSVAVGDEFDGAPKLRKLLLALGDLGSAEASLPDNTLFDAPLGAAVRRFQNRHGLLADGLIGPRTYAALTTPLGHRVRQIELTLERWRWLAALPRPDIVVNIPQFMLYALPRPNQPAARTLEMPVIVGRSHTRTPVFVAAIEQVIFYPFWDVPTSIVRKELLPKIRNNPSYLRLHHFEIVRGAGDDARVMEPTAAAINALAAGRLRLRQRPGPDNALGPVKFVLPNPYAIRLHGTPEQALFGQSSRAFSHGCIRVSDPAALAEYVLRTSSQEWDAAAVEAAICGTKTQRVTLTIPVRVVVFYATAAATESRGVLFSEDIYGYDRRLEELLER